MLGQYAAVKQQQQQAYECCSSRVLLECRLVLLLLLNARVPVTAWPRRAGVCLVLVALEQSSDRGPGSFFLCAIPGRLENLLIMLVRSSAAREVRSSTRTAATDECCSNRVLLECC